jgi:hypothetical protein
MYLFSKLFVFEPLEANWKYQVEGGHSIKIPIPMEQFLRDLEDHW